MGDPTQKGGGADLFLVTQLILEMELIGTAI
jgi:hypothetical protein